MKRILFLMLISILAISCKQKPKECNVEVTALSSLKKSEIKNDQAISIADVKSSDNESANVSNVKSNVSAQENGTENKADGTVNAVPKVIKKKIIKDGTIGLQVENLQKAKLSVDSLVKSIGGYYASENLQNSDHESGYQLTIRIPVLSFDKFINSIEKGKGKVLTKVINARDVTEEFTDLQTRISSKRNSLARYNEIMKKANTVKDIVAIEESIRVLQEEIESSEGKLRYLNDCVDYSTLTLTISTEKDFTFKPEKRDSFWEKLKQSTVEGWYNLVDFILSLFSLWPYLIIIIPVLFLIRKWVKKYRFKRKQQKE